MSTNKKILLVILSTLLSICILAGCASQLTYSPTETVVLKPPSRGYWDGNVYKNDFAGFAFTMPDGWIKLSDEELAEVSEEYMNTQDQTLQDGYDSIDLDSVYIMLCGNPETGAKVMVVYDNLDFYSYDSYVTEEEYVNEIKNQITTRDYATYEFLDDTGKTIGGKHYTGILYKMTDQSGETLTFEFLAYKINNYMVCIMLDYRGKDSLLPIISSFSDLNPALPQE